MAVGPLRQAQDRHSPTYIGYEQFCSISPKILRACAGIAARKASFTSIHTLPGCLACNGRFGGSPFDLMMPVVEVIGIFAKETGQSQVFQVVIHCANTHKIGAPRLARLYSVARGGKPPARQDAGSPGRRTETTGSAGGAAAAVHERLRRHSIH